MGKIRCTLPEEKAKKKADILREARNFFAKQSFFEITMGQIADQIGLAKGTIYLYFKTKEDLFFELLREDVKYFFKSAIEQIYFFELIESKAIWRKKLVSKTAQTTSLGGFEWQITASDNLALAFSQSLEKSSLADLLILLKPILEEKMAPKNRQIFREWIQSEIQELSKVLVRFGYFENITFSNRFTYQAFAAAIGLYQLSAISREPTSFEQQTAIRSEFQLALKTLLISIYRSYQIESVKPTKLASTTILKRHDSIELGI